MPKLKLYFKTHKPLSKWWIAGEIPPARPIVTQHAWFTKCCGYVLTYHLGKILACVRRDHVIALPQNSFQLVEQLRSKGIMSRGHQMVATADFDSLYSNLPISIVHKAANFFAAKYARECEEFRFWNTSFFNEAPRIPMPEFLPKYPVQVNNVLDALLFLVLYLNVFKSETGSIFAQKEGIAMGLGCAPILADLTLAFLENEKPENFNGAFIARYLDDMIVIGEADVIQAVVAKISGTYPLRVTFTEPACACTYLDLNLRCNPDSIDSGVFFKEENNALYIPYKSAHPLAQRISWLRGELIRYIRLCSNEHEFNIARTRFVLAALSRGYPHFLIVDNIAKVQWKDKNNFLTVRPKPNKISIAYKMPFHTWCGRKYSKDPAQLIRKVNIPPGSTEKFVNRQRKIGWLHCPLPRRLD